MNGFHDRGPEQEALRRSFETDGASLFVLYGRRRLGKTTLLQRFAEGKPGVYHLADRATEKDAIRLLARSMASSVGDGALAEPTYATFGDLFTAYDRVRPRSGDPAPGPWSRRPSRAGSHTGPGAGG
jgi:AAA+ ATPase superfamily predicted ATPase